MTQEEGSASAAKETEQLPGSGVVTNSSPEDVKDGDTKSSPREEGGGEGKEEAGEEIEVGLKSFEETMNETNQEPIQQQAAEVGDKAKDGDSNNQKNNPQTPLKKMAMPNIPMPTIPKAIVETPTKFVSDAVAVVHQTVIPKMEKLPVHLFVVLCFFIAIPTSIYIYCFTALGQGEAWFYYLADVYGDQYAATVFLGSFGLFVVLYLLDMDTWKNVILQRIFAALCLCGAGLTPLFLTGDYPYGPLVVLASFLPLYLVVLNRLQIIAFCNGYFSNNSNNSINTNNGNSNEDGGRQQPRQSNKLRTRDYVSLLSGPLFAVSLITFLVWFAWTFLKDTNEYNRVTIAKFAQLTGCIPNFDDYPECQKTPASIDDGTFTIVYDNTTLASEGNGTFLSSTSIDAIGSSISNTSTIIMTNETVIVADSSSSSASTTPLEYGVCFEIIENPLSFHFPTEDCDIDCPQNVYDDCLNAFILWAGPVMVSMVLFFLSFFCTFLKGDDAEKDMISFLKLWMFLTFTIWLTASLAGVGGGLSSALVSMTLGSSVGSVIFVAATRTTAESKTQAIQMWERLEQNYGDYLDIGRAFLLITCTPFIIFYLILSVMNQAVRKLGLPCSKKLTTDEAKTDFVTKRTRRHIKLFLSWDRSKILTYAVLMGICYIMLQVLVSQFTVLFLSWLIEYTQNLGLGVVTVLLSVVGMLLFLLPPVPGVPIYLTLGIVVLAVGRDTLGIVGGMVYAAVVSLLLKLVACAVQQKLIGENLARYVSVRKLVGINSNLIKATRLILAEEGMGIAKVCILVGGPDWPTSVLCGIMGLDLIPVLVGTLPVFVLILPTMLLGSFTYMAGLRTEDGELEFGFASVLATVFAAVTSLVMMAAMILAAYHLEQTISNRADEIDAIEIDKEVADLEAAEVAFNKAYTKVTEWERVPTVAKLVLYLAFVCLVTSCYMIQFFGGRCFADYQLTYTIDDHLDGNWLNLVLPLGWIAILIFVLGSFLLYGFVSWANSKAKQELELSPTTDEEQDADYAKKNEEVAIAQAEIDATGQAGEEQAVTSS